MKKIQYFADINTSIKKIEIFNAKSILNFSFILFQDQKKYIEIYSTTLIQKIYPYFQIYLAT